MLTHHPTRMAKLLYGVVALLAMVAIDGWRDSRAHAEDAVAIQPVYDGSHCLDADLGSIGRNGTTVQLWECWGGLNQAWIFQSSSTGFPTFSIKNAQSGRCLDLFLGFVRIPLDGVPVVLSDCRDDALSQK